MSYYDEIGKTDIIAYMRPQLERGVFNLRDSDGKLFATANMAWNTPWHHIKHAFLDCQTWHRVIFDFIASQLETPFVPSKCQNCWKVVVRPGTLEQLFALERLQKQLDVPCKCGIEIRNTVHGLYGGYFYNYSFPEGLERYKQVREEVNQEPLLGPDIPVFLKRACTEFEHLCGDSKFWGITPKQRELEAMVDRYVVSDDMQRRQPDHLVRHVHRKWIEYAFANGDATYKIYTDGKPLYPAYRTYHHLANKTDEEINQFWAEVLTGHTA